MPRGLRPRPRLFPGALGCAEMSVRTQGAHIIRPATGAVSQQPKASLQSTVRRICIRLSGARKKRAPYGARYFYGPTALRRAVLGCRAHGRLHQRQGIALMARRELPPAPARNQRPRRSGVLSRHSQFGEDCQNLGQGLAADGLHRLGTGVKRFRGRAIGEDHLMPIEEEVVIYNLC